MAGLAGAKRIVVKLGSSLLTDLEKGEPRFDMFERLAADVARLFDDGVEIVIVSSGAVSIGRRALKLPAGRLSLEHKQAAAAAGQTHLAEVWRAALGRHGRIAAQTLVTISDTETRRRWLNARETFATLLSLGAVPIINENDTVATEELRYGDNDRLAARIAAMVDADAMVILSDVDGLCTADPSRDPNATLIERVEVITDEIEALAGGVGAAGTGTGGMATKIAAARIATEAGCAAAIACGERERPLLRLMEPGVGTWFVACTDKVSARAAFISGALSPQGVLVLDDGAAHAVRNGRNLLPAGVIEARGMFGRGEAVRLIDSAGGLIGKGLVAYDAEDTRRLLGEKTRDIESVLGYRRGAALVHATDMVLEA